jgi:hypothetical protein
MPHVLEPLKAPDTVEAEAPEQARPSAVFEVRTGGYRDSMPGDVRYAEMPYAGQPIGGQHKVVGLLSWGTIALCVLGILRFPGQLTIALMLIVAYLMARMIFTVVYSAVGSARCADWAKRDWTRSEAVADLVRGGGSVLRCEDVHHVVLVPNYKETAGVLEATIQGVARQHRASECVTLVLAMEAKEPGSAEKGAALAERFAGRFANILVTLHPGNLPGEIACKGSNEAWAAREAKRFLVDDLGMPIESITVTSCDADSILHRDYLTAVGRMFAADDERHSSFWQAPMLYYNNIWKVPVPTRFMAYFTHALFMGELANPFSRPMPLSTYTLSLKMLHQTGYWDTAVISEDWHIFLQCYFANGGKVNLRRVFLPTTADMPDGDTAWEALVALYHQSVRHSWGAEDVGYLLQRWPESDVPAVRTTLLFEHVTRDHLMRSMPWFVFGAASVLSAMTSRGLNPLPLDYPLLALTLRYLWIGSSVMMLGLLGIELWRYPPSTLTKVPARVVEMLAAWVMLPVISLAFGAVPALYAQTKLMLGFGLNWRVTPKRLAPRLEES